MGNVSWPEVLPRPGNQKFEQVKGVSPWFDIRQIGDGVFAFIEPYHEEEVISYLVLGTEKAALIDTGMGIGNIQKEVEQLTDLPVIVVNTHAHTDHVGDNWRFDEVWIFDHEAEITRLTQGKSQANCAGLVSPGSYINPPPDFDPATYESRPSPMTRRLHHQETIDLGGRMLTVHHTPGETRGAICLLDSRDGLLFTGDTICAAMNYVDPSDPDGVNYLKSMEYLVDLGDRVKHLGPGHNEAYAPRELLVNVRDALRKIIAGELEPEAGKRWRMYRFEEFGVALPNFDAW